MGAFQNKKSFRSLAITLIIAFLIPAFLILTIASSLVGYFIVARAHAPLDITFKILGLVFILGGVMATTAAIYIAKIITRPIVALRDTAVKLGKGELDTRIHFPFHNEISQLAEDFNEIGRAHV